MQLSDVTIELYSFLIVATFDVSSLDFDDNRTFYCVYNIFT